MGTRTTPHSLRAPLIVGLFVCAPAHAHSDGHLGAVGYGGVGFHGGFALNRDFDFRGGCCFRSSFDWWGWPGYGLFLATLPAYYSTWWWNGVPYSHAYDNYYVWNNGTGGYQAVAPPPQVGNQAAAQRGEADSAYPKNSQSAEQQGRDRQECRDWAALQTGFGTGSGRTLRAQAACHEGGGHGMK